MLFEAIGFDWDGTLLDSMKIKSQSFAESFIRLYPNLSKERAEIENIFLANGGNPRNYQLNSVQKRFSLGKLSSEETQKWSDLFTSLYLDKKSLLFDDAIKVLDELKRRGYKLFLCSSVPQDDLNKTIKLYPLKDYFLEILGTRDNGKFRKGLPHFTYVSERIGVPLNKMAFVGDGSEDVKVANKAGCFSVGRVDPRLPSSKEEILKSNPKMVIEKLEELLLKF